MKLSEILWGEVKTSAHAAKPSNPDDPERLTKEIWSRIDQEICKKITENKNIRL